MTATNLSALVKLRQRLDNERDLLNRQIACIDGLLATGVRQTTSEPPPDERPEDDFCHHTGEDYLANPPADQDLSKLAPVTP